MEKSMFMDFSGFHPFKSFVHLHHLFLNSHDLFIYMSNTHATVYLHPESDFNVL